jgi:hypothetical protein
MIIRSILTDTEEVIANFDFFNNYDDTLRWLVSSEHYLIAVKLQDAYKEWLKARTIEYKRNYIRKQHG